MIKKLFYSLFFLLSCTAASHAAVISIIIDDLGYDYARGKQVLRLPAPVTLSILPETPHARKLSREAAARGHEVMLHLPMQAVAVHHPAETGALTIDTLESEFKSTLVRYLETYPEAAGINNHMGSLLTRHPGHMAWLMQTLAMRDGLYFVDSRTTDKTVAATIAAEYAIPHTSRNVFLDNEPTEKAIRAQLWRLARMAKREGQALAIGHPHPATIRVLKQMLPQLEAKGFEIVPVSRYIQLQEETRPWRVSSSPSPKAVKN